MNDNRIAPADSFENYHQRNCKICRHPERAAIEHDFLHWRSPERISREYDFSARAVYRHAHALNLFDRRRRNLRDSLEYLIEGADRVDPTADGVLRAIQLYARMDDVGQIREIPKTQVIVISRDGVPAVLPPAPETRFGQMVPVSLQISSAPEPASLPGQPVNPSQTEIGVSH